MSPLKFLTLLCAFVCLSACKSAQHHKAPAPEAGLFKVSVFYANGEGKTFDMDYYEKKHMPMVAGFIGDNLKFYEVDKGVSGRTEKDPVPFLAIGHFYVRDITAYNQAIAKNRDAIISDFKFYTNIQPTVQISELVQVR